MEPGDVIEAIVTAVRPYGVEIAAGALPGFVQPVELDWDPTLGPGDVARVGQALVVRVLAVAEDRFSASIKRAHPELDPWRDGFEVGARYAGTVYAVTSWGVFVSIGPGVEGVVLGPPDSHPAVGDAVRVEVASYVAELRKLTLRWLPEG